MFEIPKNIDFIIHRLTENGHKAYLVGGCVRDFLLGEKPQDFDITTSATPDEICSLFEKTIPTGIAHGTVTVMVKNQTVEVTTFRTEKEYTDNRRPDNVKFVGNINEDLSRRDFTINAMAYNQYDGLIDIFSGETDLKNKILRTVGNAECRFKEDALRILRLFRFASTLGFKIEENTLKSALKCAHLLQNVSRERIFIEIKKAIIGDNFEIFTKLIQCGSLEFLNITDMPNFKKIKKHKNNLLICLYCFLNIENLENLKPSNKEREFFKAFDLLSSLPKPQNNADIKEMLNLCDSEIVKSYFEYKEWDYKAIDRIINSNEPYKISHLMLNGSEIAKLGFKGEEIGEILEKLRKVVIENPKKNNKKDLLNEIA